MILGSWRNLYFQQNYSMKHHPNPHKTIQKETDSPALPQGVKRNKFTKVNRTMSQQVGLKWGRKATRSDSQLNGTQIRAYSQTSLSLKIHSSNHIKKQHSSNNSRLQLSREEKSIFALDPALEKLRRERNLDDKGVQIKYVNTLKKIKKASSQLGCKVKVQSSGFTLQNTKQKQTQQEQAFNYNFSKQFNRYFKRKLVQKLDNCQTNSISLEETMNRQVEQMAYTVKINKKSHQYQHYTSNRMQTYLRGVSTQHKKMPFFVKKDLDQTLSVIKSMKQVPIMSKKGSQIQQNAAQLPLSPTESPKNRGSKNSTSTKWTLLLNEFQEDIAQFEQICDFFERIQHQLLRYMPNNHLSNRINNIIAQVEHSAAIRKIYNQCNEDISLLTPQRIVKYLRKEQGILSCMNYIVNVIKLNISAQRRKRFQDLQKVINKYQSIAVTSAAGIADKMKKIGSPQIKKCIEEAVKKTDINCRGMDPSYLSFVRQAEEQEFSSINTTKNRNIICEILKFESLMK